MAKKLKDIVRVNAEPARGKVGLDPMDPWSAKANIAESASLNQYLLSRGINPKFVSPATKISHAKSSAFLKWKMNHQFEEIQTEEIESIAEGRMKDIATDASETQRLNKMTTLQKFRAGSAAREKKHDDIEREMKSRHAAGKEDMKGSIDRLEKHLNKEETLSELNYDTVKSLYKKRRDDFHGSQVGKKKKGKEVSAKNVSRSISRLTGFKPTQNQPQKEEVEQIDEISKTTLSSYRDKSSASLKNAQANRDAAEPGKHMSKGFADLHAKSDAIAKKRVKGLIGYMQRKQGMKPTSENTLDPLAATEAPCDCANTSDDTTPKQKAMSKSARIIKSLYKRKGVVKEDMYDHEKEDKSVQTYGKKPKVMEPDENKNLGEKKPDARIVMSGGTTLTGEKRDTVEIDPLMKNRPGPDTFGATGKKASQQ